MAGPSAAAPSGLLLVDKPRGWTSHDVVAAVRRCFPKGTRVGHAGTLDPRATGLLVLLVGKATRQAQRLLGLAKVYRGAIRLGVRTDTGDLDGRVTSETPIPEISSCYLEELFARHLGEVEMPVPAYSAVKHQGRPLYRYAREGEAVPVKTRRSVLTRWELLSWRPPEAEFLVECSSGTYVRSLAELVGAELGCGGALSALRRERVGGYDVSAALAMDQVRALCAQGALASKLVPLDER